jgi:hypothetical protein
MRVLAIAASILGWMMLCGCAGSRVATDQPPDPAGGTGSTRSAASTPARIVTPEEGVVGRVASVNKELRFVVLTFPLGQMPGLDQRLNVYRRNLKVGEIRITGPQSDDSIVGDVVSGEAGAGDAVREK